VDICVVFGNIQLCRLQL